MAAWPSDFGGRALARYHKDERWSDECGTMMIHFSPLPHFIFFYVSVFYFFELCGTDIRGSSLYIIPHSVPSLQSPNRLARSRVWEAVFFCVSAPNSLSRTQVQKSRSRPPLSAPLKTRRRPTWADDWLDSQEAIGRGWRGSRDRGWNPHSYLALTFIPFTPVTPPTPARCSKRSDSTRSTRRARARGSQLSGEAGSWGYALPHQPRGCDCCLRAS